MSKYIFLYYVIAFICFIGLFVFIGESRFMYTSHEGCSQNINESKKRGVYICQYKTETNPYVINDSLKLNIKEAWLEKCWDYGDFQCQTNPMQGKYQLIVVASENDLDGLGIRWGIGIDAVRYLRGGCSKNSLITEFNYSMPKHIECWDVQEGTAFMPHQEHNIIGKFELIRKD